MVYFQSALSSTCEDTTIFIGNYGKPIYPEEADFNKPVYFNIDFIADFVGLTIIQKHMPCQFYEVSFDILLNGNCKYLGSSLMKGDIRIYDDIWKVYPNVSITNNCENGTSFQLCSLESGVILSHCNAFKINQNNKTYMFMFDFELQCSVYGETSMCSYLRYHKTGPSSLQNVCYPQRIFGCSFVVTVAVDQKCSLVCLHQIQFAIKDKGIGTRIHFFSSSFLSPHIRAFNIHIPAYRSNAALLVLYPVYDSECKCEMSFQTNLNPYHGSPKDKLEYIPHHDISRQRISYFYRGKSYIYSHNTAHSWEQAEIACGSLMAGHLWAISDLDELYAVLDHFLQSSPQFMHSRAGEGLHTKVLYIGLKSNQVKCY